MPRFDKSKRYKDKNGHTFGKGVWYDDKGKMIRPGIGYEIDRKTRTISQYNSDGTITHYPWEKWAEKKVKEGELQVLKNDRNYGIPFIPEKKVTISIDENSPTKKNAGATFSENLLDSIAVNAKKAGLPFSTALGIVAKESTFGAGERSIGKTFLPWNRALDQGQSSLKQEAKSISYKGVQSPSLLVSNWKQRNAVPFHNYFYDEQGLLLENPVDAEFYDKDINSSRRKGNNYKLEEVSPLYYAFRDYRQNPYNYNHNDKHYPDKVQAHANELVNYSPEIQEYMKKYNLHGEGGPLETPKTWDNLSMAEKSEMMRVAIENGITTLPEIKEAYNEFALGGDTVGEWVDAIYQNNPQEEFLGEPEHHYDFTQSEEWANAHGYYPDARGHRDDGVKKPAHPSHPSRGAWDGDKFILSELGMQNPNYTLFDLNDGEQDPQAVLTYQGASVIPEITVTPNGNYFFNPYDNIKLKFAEGGNLFSGEENHSSQMHQGYVYDVLPKMLKEAGLNVRVTSGYRRPGQAGKAGSRSWHTHHGAVDIVPQGKTTFEDIENALYNNPIISRYMRDNGFGLIDESGRTAESKATMKKTGATGAHFHIGKDSKAVSAYNNKMSSIWDSSMSQLESAINQPTLPVFMPSNPQAFFAPLESYQRPVVVEEPLVQAAMENPYSPEQLEREERAQGLRNLGLAMSIMRGGQEQSYSPLWSAVSMLSGNQMAKGGKIHIKPENRGKFTALKKRTGHSATWFKQHGTPAQKKMATFALNSRHWNKHALGGYLEGKEYDLPQEEIKRLIDLGYEIEYL